MHYPIPAPASSPAVSHRLRPGQRVLRALLPAAVLGAGLWLFPSEASAAPRCSSKPAVCARIANERKARPQPAPIARTASTPTTLARQSSSRCNSKPIVCARLESMGGVRAPQPPVTLASHAAGDRCTSKPAVCARLKLKPKAAPMTLAKDDPRGVTEAAQ
jgi:hypothetical protein